MPNTYYDNQDAGGRFLAGETARGSDVDAKFDAVEAGFDQLPTADDIKGGQHIFGTDSGTASAYVVTMPYTPTAYTTGMQVRFAAANASTGASTINVDSLGIKVLKRQDGTALRAGDIPANSIVSCTYNGTDFLMDASTAVMVSNAETAATNAASSASAASTSETNAASSASAASTSASNASTSETNAASSASAASTSETNAGTSETNAAASASAASTSEANAATSASNAATSASNAATSESNAATSASNAATSEANAASSASAASTSATNAATSATNAATSETNASTSETNAASSATAAASSATAAASSATAAEVAKIEWQGTWSGVTTYAVNDAVTYNGTSYICTTEHTNQAPPNATYWDVLAQAGIGDLSTSDIGVTVQGYDADTTKNDVANTFTATQTFNSTANFTGEIQLNSSAGTPGQVLTSQGSGVDPIWAAASGGVTLATVKQYTSSTTWNKSSSEVKVIKIIAVGGGGGGSGSTSALTGAGGAGGGTVIAWFDVETLSTSANVSVVIGGGGSGGGSGSVGSGGGTTYISHNGEIVVNGLLGGGGRNGAIDQPGLGGTATASGSRLIGQPITVQGAGGGAGQDHHTGVTLGGAGGGNFLYSTQEFSYYNGSLNGQSLTFQVYGTGGMGAASNGTSGGAGANGQGGIMYIEEYA